MASHLAIAAASKAILGLIEDQCPRPMLVNPKFKLYHAKNFEEPMAEGFSLYLYRISVNTTLRNLPPRRMPDGRRLRPSLPLDLHYLLTPWAGDPERQQRLLGWAMRFLEDRPTLPAGVLNHYLAEANTFRPEEAIELVCDPLPMQDLFNLWDKLKPKMQTSVTYIARMVLLDSEIEIDDAGLAQTREFKSGELVSL